MQYKIESSDEAQSVELPALILLHEGLGYDYLTNDEINQIRKRTEVVLFNRLKKQLPILNPWMKKYPVAIDSAIDELKRITQNHAQNHTDINEIIHAMYTETSKDSIKPLEIQFDSGKGEVFHRVKLFDFENPEKNDFVVSNQVHFTKHKGRIEPDIVIFVNGFPLVVVECKAPNKLCGVNSAIEDNLKRYQIPDNGADRLFFYNLFLIATSGDYAKHGCIQENVDSNFYSRWSSTYPYDPRDVEKFAQRVPREQENLLVGMLAKENLIRILENFVIFDKVNRMNIKKISKHQQFRAVQKSIKQLDTSMKNSTNLGGTIWHSQGSGKSLTMFWLAKQIRRHFVADYPILVITDRNSLDSQIHGAFESAGWHNPIRVNNAQELVDELQSPEKKVIMSTIQKLGLKDNPDVLTDKTVIVLTDESHRTEFGKIATRMRSALPNGIFFAFTATPIDKPHKKVFQKFGAVIDKYPWAESRDDGVTVRIEIRSKRFPLSITDTSTLFEDFEKTLIGLSTSEKNKVKKEFDMKKLMRATDRIKNIAKFVVEDFNARVGIEGFKAMLVTDGREAAVRYKKALDAIPNAPKSIIVMTSNLGDTGIEDDNWDQYYLPSNARQQKAKEFSNSDDQNQILIVSDMLLTGYDAPIVQTMYLDKKLREHTLLQAIARVNRKYKHKQTGTIVDLIDIIKELDYAKKMFDVDETKELTFEKDFFVGHLKTQRDAAMFDIQGIDPKINEQILEKFASESSRDIFYIHYRNFERALDSVMPEPEADPFLEDFVTLTDVKNRIMDWLDKDKFSVSAYSKKIQQMIDRYIVVGKIKKITKIIDFDDTGFRTELDKLGSRGSQNSAMTARIVGIIKMYKPDNPNFYESIEERLYELLKNLATSYRESELFYNQLSTLLDDSQKEYQIRLAKGLKNGFAFAVFEKLKNHISDEQICVNISNRFFDKIYPFTNYVDWTEKTIVENDIGRSIYESLNNVIPSQDIIDQLSDEIMDLAKRHLNEK